ncbi:MAG: MBL fold metallo-hydrolase [Anaerolineales bacterium]|nr:MBL fold metallo-hydrolase [Anaerolineales bacterium]
MEVHHLNCGTIYPFGLPDVEGNGGFFKRGQGVIHCLLVDTGDGLVLVDTGWGMRDYSDPSPIVGQFMDLVGSPRDMNDAAINQVEMLGYDQKDVKHIFLTHMHLDHAGGLPDFPDALVHIFAAEMEACLHPKTLMERSAYRPEHHEHGPKWQSHSLRGDQWFGLDCTAPLEIGGIEIVMVPFAGHTRGHCAVALRMGDRWLLHCGDLYGYHRQVDPVQPYKHPCGGLMESIVRMGFKIPKGHWIRIRELLRAHGDQIQTFCAHDAHEFGRFHRLAL